MRNPVTVGTDHGQENIYGSDAVVGLLKTAKKTERLRVILHLREQKDFEEKISVEFCGYFKNEIRIGAQTTPEAVEFVVRRIWERAKEGKLPPSPVDAFAGEAPVNSPLLDVDFDTFSRHHPYLANALLRLQRWIKKNPAVEYLDPERLRKALGGGVAKYDAAAAVGKLVDAGVLVRKYKVRPKGKRRFQDAVFDSLDDVLEAELVDEDDQPINLREAEVVPVYGAAEKPQATSGRNGDGERDAVGANGKGRG